MRFRATLALVALLATGCGSSSPAAPSDPSGAGSLPFQAGRYRLSIIGLQCGSPAFDTPLPSVFLGVTLQSDGAAWVAVPEPSNGTLRLRFEKGPAIPNLTAVVLSGTMSGTADDEGPAGTPGADATRVAIAVASVSGTMLSPESAAGRIEGPVVFTRAGSSIACIPGAVSWTLARFGLSQGADVVAGLLDTGRPKEYMIGL
jgi:hypothetical protein